MFSFSHVRHVTHQDGKESTLYKWSPKFIKGKTAYKAHISMNLILKVLGQQVWDEVWHINNTDHTLLQYILLWENSSENYKTKE